MAKVTGMKDGNVTYITQTTGQAALGSTGGTGNSAPSKTKDMIVDVGAAEAEGTLFDVMAMIDVTTLFDDVEDGLTYNITVAPTGFTADVMTDEGIDEYMHDGMGTDDDEDGGMAAMMSTMVDDGLFYTRGRDLIHG